MNDLVLGVDAGGSHCRAVLASAQGEILGRGQAGSANSRTASFENAAVAIQRSISQALAKTAVRQVSAICIGSAGLEEPGSAAQGRKLLGTIVRTDNLIFDTDAYIAWAGALELQAGVIVIAGTGSMGFGIDTTGQRFRVGGWGPYFGDEGSAYALARSAIQEALKVLDGRQQDERLLKEVLSFAGLSPSLGPETALRLTEWLYQPERSPGAIAGFSAVLDELAKQNHPLSQSLLAEAGKSLAVLAEAVSSKFATRALHSFGGSVLLKSEVVRSAFFKQLSQKGLEYRPPSFSPVIGAVLIALESQNMLSANSIAQFRQSLKKEVATQV